MGLAIGAQDSFSWRSVAMSAVSGGISGGLAGWAQFEWASVGNAMARAAVGNAATQGIGIVTGLQDRFDWRGVAASAVGAGVGQAVGAQLGNGFGGRLSTGLIAGTAAAVMRGGKVAIQQVAVDAFGNALGESLAGSMSGAGQTGPTTGDFARMDGADYRSMPYDAPNAAGGLRFGGGSYGLQLTPGAVSAMDDGINEARGGRILAAMRDADVARETAALNAQNAARIARENGSQNLRELNRFASMAQDSGAATFDLRALRKAQDARELAAYQARLSGMPVQYASAYDPAAARATAARNGALLNFLGGQGSMALGGVVAAGASIGSGSDAQIASIVTDMVAPFDNLAAPMGGGAARTSSASGSRRNNLLGGSPATNAASYAQYQESLTRMEFSEQAAWKPASTQGDQLVNHAYNRHPSLATTADGLISPALYNQRARANIVNMDSQVHSLGGTKYASFNQTSGEMTVFSFEGGGGLQVGTPTIHSYYIPLRNELTKGIPFILRGKLTCATSGRGEKDG